MSRKHRGETPAPTSQIQSSSQVHAISAEMFSGPLPHPNTLREYDAIVPGAAKMILDKFEAQTDHRRDIESRVVKANIQQAYLGQVLAFILLLLLIGSGCFLIYEGRNAGGLTAITSAVGAAVIVYLKGRSAKANELEAKRGTRR